MSKGPARNYKWRDAWPGNDLALKHGARSPRIVEPLARECAAYIAEVIEAEALDYLKLPSFAIALDNLAWSWAQVLKLREWAIKHPEDMKARDQLDKAEARFDKRLAACGFYPLNKAKLQAVLTSATRDEVNLAAEIERAREARRTAEARHSAREASGGANDAASVQDTEKPEIVAQEPRQRA